MPVEKPYEFQEYPKHVTVGGRVVVCHNEDEEQTALAGAEVINEADERKRLMAVAEIAGLKVDKRWSLDRIAQNIRDNGADPELNPFA